MVRKLLGVLYMHSGKIVICDQSNLQTMAELPIDSDVDGPLGFAVTDQGGLSMGLAFPCTLKQGAFLVWAEEEPAGFIRKIEIIMDQHILKSQSDLEWQRFALQEASMVLNQTIETQTF